MRRLTSKRIASFLLCGLAAAPSPLFAQGRARVQTAETAQPNAASRERRPEAEPLHVEAVSPQLEAVLQEWYQKTQDIQELQGQHTRWLYDTTFGVVKIAKGSFYYKGPDKGRIDIEPIPPKPNQQVSGPGGVTFTLKQDTPERWICDGERTVRIDEAAKNYEVAPIPEQFQGANIMDSALPFLFGMPPEAAKKRYSMKLVERDDTAVLLEIRPKRREDAASWQRADVKLNPKTFLPTAVQLIDPPATGVTVYKFEEVQVNPNKIIALFKGDPFKPILIGYKPVQQGAPAPAQPLTPQGQPIDGMPSIVGMKVDDAKGVLGARGFRTVNVQRGPMTDEPALRHCVAEQTPAPGANAKPGEKVTLLLYIMDADLTKDAAGTRPGRARP